MEQKHKIKLTTSSTFVLEKEEIRRLYTYLSLFEYRYLRIPDYRERSLIEHLEKDFKKYYVEMQKQTEQDPNNLTLNRIRTFFDNHYRNIKEISDKYKLADNESE